MQCYKSTGYCWCVEEASGRPIPGTSVKNERPDCSPDSGLRQETRLEVVTTAWKKCGGARRADFISGLLDHID